MEHGTHSMYVHRRCRCGTCRAGEREYQAQYRRRNVERIRAYDRSPERDSRLRDDPAKRSVRWAAWYATRDSSEPCEVCGSEPAERHHDDYSAPLEIRWLCRKCHATEHVAA